MDFSSLIPLSIIFSARCSPAYRETWISVSLYPTINISISVLSRHLICPGSCDAVYLQHKPGQSVMHTLLSDIKWRHRVVDTAIGLLQPVRHQLICISIVMLCPIYSSNDIQKQNVLVCAAMTVLLIRHAAEAARTQVVGSGVRSIHAPGGKTRCHKTPGTCFLNSEYDIYMKKQKTGCLKNSNITHILKSM